MNKLIIFDLDGVIFNSKENMKKSWKDVKTKLQLKVSFKTYFNNVGLPFKKILQNLNIKKKNFLEAEKIYKKSSIDNFHLIKTYPYVYSTINYLKKKKYTLAVLTSKDRSRTLKLLKKFNLNFKYVQCPTKNGLGKPNPGILNLLQKKLKFKRKYIYYIGDTYLDYQFSKKSKINFIFSNYGYGKLKNKSVKKISKLSNLKNIF
jgi:phosphoglycolate phosphatase